MCSQKKLEANRRNAQKSTGPRTAEGKARSSRNAVTHGLFCQDAVLPGESQEQFDALRLEFLQRLCPQDLLELSLVDRIVLATWKLRRLQEAEKIAHECRAEPFEHFAPGVTFTAPATQVMNVPQKVRGSAVEPNVFERLSRLGQRWSRRSIAV
jgi:hypothetical protein